MIVLGNIDYLKKITTRIPDLRPAYFFSREITKASEKNICHGFYADIISMVQDYSIPDSVEYLTSYIIT